MNTALISENICKIREKLPKGVKLEAAAKTRSAEEIKTAVESGVDFLGYNYVQEGIRIAAELKERYGTDFSDSVQYNLIGHLQTNKINKALSLYGMIETIDSVSRAEALSRRADRNIDVLIQVNIGEEKSKSGASADRIAEIAAGVAVLDNITLRGLMTIEPYTEDPAGSRGYFRKMNSYYRVLQQEYGSVITYLSMGMSHSWEIAVEEGATVIRVGTALFGVRN